MADYATEKFFVLLKPAIIVLFYIEMFQPSFHINHLRNNSYQTSKF